MSILQALQKSPEEINKGIKKWMEFLGKMKTSSACASFLVNVDEAHPTTEADSADAGGDAGTATPATPTTEPPPASTAVPAAGDTDAAGVDKQCAGDEAETPSPFPSSRPSDGKQEGGQPPGAQSRGMGSPPVVYVRVPIDQYQAAQYPSPVQNAGGGGRGGGGGWDAGGGGAWGSGGGGGGGGGGYWAGLRDTADWEDTGAFSMELIRRAFIRKVYATLSLQLALTVAIIAIFMFQPDVKYFVLTTPPLLYTAMGVFFVVYLTLVCCGDVRRKYPCNVILLFIFTLSLAYMLGMVSAIHRTYIVFMAVAMTTIITLLVTMVATFSKVDITGCGALLFVLGLGVAIFGLVVMIVHIWYPSHLLMAIYGGLTCIVFSMYLMFDTQLIMGGRYLELSPEEYIFAAMMLYVDIIMILWSLILLLSYCCGD